MNTLDVQAIDPNLVAAIKTLPGSKEHLDDVVGKMRSAGFNKIQSMKLLRDCAGISLMEAKRIVHLSPAWADRLETDNHFQRTAIQVANLIR
jgi:ribosomal protein L7/L12